MNSNLCRPFGTTMPLLALFICVLLLGFRLPAPVRADLPSCIRAKCTHCRVPFIAEMCPGACAVCGPSGSKIFFTTAQQTAQVPDARAFGQAQVKVPFAQQVPLPGSVGGGTAQPRAEAVPAAQQQPRQQQQQQRQAISRVINNNNNINNHNNGRQQQQKSIRNQYGTDFGVGPAENQQQQPLPFQHPQGQFVPVDQQQGGQFGQNLVPTDQQHQIGQFGQNLVPTDQQHQIGQFGPPPQNQQGQFAPADQTQGGQFGLPPQNQQGQFVPADQTQGGQFVPQQQQTTSFGGFYNQPQQQQQPDQFYPQAGFGPVPPPPPPLPPPVQSADAAAGGGGTFANPFQPFLQQSFNSAQQFQAPQQAAAPNGFTFAPPPFGTPIQPQQPQQYFGQYNLQTQQQQNNNNDNNNNNNNFNNGQQQFNANNNNPQEAFQAQPTPVLHAVPNVADPLQRPHQFYQASQEPSDKNLQNLVEPNNFALDKGAIGDEVKKPFIPNGFIQGENGPTCPKQPNWEPCVPKEIANQRFRNCCARLGDGCSQLCSYDQNLSTIQLAVLTGRCPISRVGQIMVCASGNEDATACCQAFGVFEAGFDHCRPYCNPSGGLPNDGMLAEKYRCLQKLQQIQKCFYLTQRP